MRVYYAHCKSIYGTPQEERDIKLLEALGFEVYNPNRDWGVVPPWDKNNPMDFFCQLVTACDCLAFRGLPGIDGLPAGIGAEVTHARSKEMPVFELPSFFGKRTLGVEETRQYLKEVGER